MAEIKATIGGIAYTITAVKGITANNTEINVPLSIEGAGGGLGGYTEYNEVTVNGSDMTLEQLPISSSVAYTGIKVAHGLTSAPRLILVSSDITLDGSVKGIYAGGLYSTDLQKGWNSADSVARYDSVAFTTNTNTGNAAAVLAQYATTDDKGTWAAYGADTDYFYLMKAATNQAFGAGVTYTFKFFA